MTLHPYWLVVEYDRASGTDPVAHGIGVTSDTVEHALEQLRSDLFGGHDLPKIIDIDCDVEVTGLDPNNVLPNVGAPERAGIWYPNRNFNYAELSVSQRARLFVFKEMLPLLAWWKKVHPNIIYYETLLAERRLGREQCDLS